MRQLWPLFTGNFLRFRISCFFIAGNEEAQLWKNNRVARAARSSEQVRAVLCKTTMLNYHIHRFDEYVSIQPLIFNSVYLL